jgi:Protein of unknown function (DUF2934)
MMNDFLSQLTWPFFKERRARDELHKGLLMAKTPSSNGVRKPSSKAKSSKKTAPVAAANLSPTVEFATRLDEDLIRERAYGIWIAEGKPHGRELAHWQRAHHELQREAR